MNTITILYLTFLIYILLVIYILLYNPSTPFYKFVDSIFNSRKIMDYIHAHAKYFYLIVAATSGILMSMIYYLSAFQMIQSILIALLVICLVFTIYVFFYNPNAGFYIFMNNLFNSNFLPEFTKNHPGPAYFLWLTIAFVFIMAIYFTKKRDHLISIGAPSSRDTFDTIGLMIKLVGFLAFLVLAVWASFGLEYFLKAVYWSPVVSGIITTLLAFLFIALLLKIFHKNPLVSVSKGTGVMGLVFNILFYIPCLMNDFVDWAKHEYDITTSSSVIILFAMVFIISMNFLLPYSQSFLYDNDGTQLVSKPIYTNVFTSLGSYEDLSGVITDKETTKYNYRYSLSFWFYVNPQPPSTNGNYSKYTSIFNYGNKPNILYKADENKIMIKMKQGHIRERKIFVEEPLPLQKWNHFVINYSGGTLDVFLNNKLVGAKIETIPYMTHDEISSGEVNGIYGGLCNVKYIKQPLMKHEIEKLYNSFNGKNPPII